LGSSILFIAKHTSKKGDGTGGQGGSGKKREKDTKDRAGEEKELVVDSGKKSRRHPLEPRQSSGRGSRKEKESKREKEERKRGNFKTDCNMKRVRMGIIDRLGHGGVSQCLK